MNRIALPVAEARLRRAAGLLRRLRKTLHDLRLVERNAALGVAGIMRRRLFRNLGHSSIHHFAGDAVASAAGASG